jgi:hypothetical protein
MTCKALALGTLLAVLLLAAPAYAQDGEAVTPGVAAAASFERPPADEIQSTADAVLADPRYRPHKTLMQWLMEQMQGWRGPDLDFSKGWLAVLYWVFIAWLVLAGVASLVHIAWTLFTMLRPAAVVPARRRGPPGLPEHLRLPCDALMGMAREAAASGDYRTALHWLMLALLRSLADRGLIALHQSKTNGDYVREVSDAMGAGQQVAQFAADFDRFTYGRTGCSRSDFVRMAESVERVQEHAAAQT